MYIPRKSYQQKYNAMKFFWFTKNFKKTVQFFSNANK